MHSDLCLMLDYVRVINFRIFVLLLFTGSADMRKSTLSELGVCPMLCVSSRKFVTGNVCVSLLMKW